MSQPEEVPSTEPQISIAGEVDRLCDEFEEAWRKEWPSGHPHIESFAARVQPSQRERLICELLETELELRQAKGDFLRLEEYCSRFPELSDRIGSIFHRVVQCRRLGDYEVQEELGRGGMGVVYKSRQVHLNQVVALKILPERYLDEPQAVARFKREMQSIGTLEHPNIVRAYNAGEANGVHFLAMEYVDGIDLQRLVMKPDLKTVRPLSVGAACEALRQAALGLQHAHEHKLVHRDIKPANLMLNRSGVVKLLDLGLAKFHADRLSPDQRSANLTQAGVTMGTVDYMAPEQWENSSGADIRADIYSLGCTLFYLLAGRAPYGGESYGSNRKKLMAHVVAPIPSLIDACPECPEALEEVFDRMLAKEPEDRYGSPREVAEALEPFADAGELAGLATAVNLRDESSIASKPAIHSSEIKTSKKVFRDPRAWKKTGSRRRIARPWYRRTIAMVMAPAVLVVMMALAAWGLRGHKEEGATPSVGSSGNKESPHTSADLKQLTAGLALLPGLNGQWWFDEMPWYTPFARQAIENALASTERPGAILGDKPDMYVNANTVAVQKWLWDVVSRCREPLSEPQNRLLDDLKEISELNVDDAALADGLEKAIRQFEEDPDSANWSALDRHTHACLQHKLASIRLNLTPTGRTNRQMAEDAKKSYEEALGRYPPNHLLRRLCLADSALLYSRLLGDYRKDDTKPGEGRRRFCEARQGANVPSLFKLVTLVTWGAEASNHALTAGDYETQPFDDAEDLLAQIDKEMGLPFANHPLRAQVYTSRGWSLMNQWEVAKAREAFLAANSILGVNRKNNLFSTVEFFHTLHGLAIASRYQGNTSGVQTGFSSLVGEEVFGREGNPGEIEEAIKAANHLPDQPGRQRYVRDLTERWANSAERWADCQLYGGAASGRVVSLNSDQARKLYDRARRMAPDPGNRVVMTCKYCIISALRDELPEAGKTFAAEVTPVKDEDIIGSDRQRAALIRQVASAVLALKDKQRTNEGQTALREFLGQFHTSNYYDANRGETLELRLFAAELLLASELQANGAKAAQSDLKYLDRLLEVFKGREKMQPFLRRYYELAVRAVGNDQPGPMAEYLLAARASHRRDSPPSPQTTRVVFHLSANDDSDPGDNYAIVTPPGTIVPLKFTRKEVQQAANRGQTLAMPEELLKLIEAEQKGGRKTVGYWDDTSCFFELPEGLSKDDWKPFSHQLEYETLRRP
jgi:serine/threonine protein kinase